MNNFSAFKAKNTKICFLLICCMLLLSSLPASAQDQQDTGSIQPLRSDVGINGLTANFHWAGDFTYLKEDSLGMTDSLQTDGSSELEFVFRNVRMITPRLGVGFQVLTSIFVDSPDASFGIGSWGLGPVVRAYPFKTERFQPYVEAGALLGNNMAVGTLANSREGGNGFRVRLGLRGGVAYRITNGFGLFIEGGHDWESGRIFRSDARAWQINFGVDVYRFN